MKMNYSEVNMQISQEDKKFLELYSDSEYQKPSVTVDAVILRMIDKDTDNYRKLPEKKLQVFLTKRKYSPFINCYAIVGTFIDLNNSLADTMSLCVQNKVGLKNFYQEQLFTFGDKQRDPRTRVLSVSYMLLTNTEETLENGEWFDIYLDIKNSNSSTTIEGYFVEKDVTIILKNNNQTLENKLKIKLDSNGLEMKKEVEILSTDVAFDHIKIIYYALDRLKNKLEYTDIAFNLLSEKFTLTELKNCYEEILGTKLLDANFRRKTSELVTPLNEYTADKGHRPSQLFKHNPNWDYRDKQNLQANN